MNKKFHSMAVIDETYQKIKRYAKIRGITIGDAVKEIFDPIFEVSNEVYDKCVMKSSTSKMLAMEPYKHLLGMNVTFEFTGKPRMMFCVGEKEKEAMRKKMFDDLKANIAEKKFEIAEKKDLEVKEN
jgi:hypothetical protein